MIPLNCATSKTPCLVQEFRRYLVYKPSYSQFYVQKQLLGNHGNKGRTATNFNDIVKLADPENHASFGVNILPLSLMVPEL